MRKRRCVTRFTTFALAGLLVFGTPAEALAAGQPESVGETGTAAAGNPEEPKEALEETVKGTPVGESEDAEDQAPEELKETEEGAEPAGEPEATENQNPEEPKETEEGTEPAGEPEAAKNQNPEEPKETPEGTEPAGEPEATENQNPEEPKEMPEGTEPVGGTKPAENSEDQETTGNTEAVENSEESKDTESGKETGAAENPEDTAETFIETVENTVLRKELGGAEKSSDAGDFLYEVLNEAEKTIEIIQYSGSDTEVVIPGKIDGYRVIGIGGSAFYECESLISVAIPQGVISIGEMAFGCCKSLTDIKIPGSVTSIGDCAFQECSGLTSVVVPEGVTKIGEFMFYCCESLTSIEIPTGVTSIGDSAFVCCRSLSSVEIPSGVTSIGDEAFYCCDSLRVIEIPTGVTSIGNGTFANCDGITSIKIPENVTSIGERAFANCSGLMNIEIPERVTSIGNEAFAGCRNLVRIEIPTGVTSISNGTFVSCSGLMNIEIPEGVTSIGNEAFADCGKLVRVEIPASVTDIGSDAFPYNDDMIFYVEPNSYAETWATENGRRVVTGKMPELKQSADGFVYEVPNEAEDSIEIVGYEGKDTEVIIPGEIDGYKVKSIGNKAFYYCWDLTCIEIPGNVTSIGDDAFPYNYNIIFYVESGSYAETWATDKGRRVVAGKMPALKTSAGGFVYEVPDEAEGVIEIIGYRGSDSNIKVDIPEKIDGYSVRSIGNEAFKDCYSLTYIVIPPSVTGIGERAFYDCCNLIGIEIPGSVTNIGSDALPDNSRMIFYVESGSYAETWAKDSGRRVVTGKMPALKYNDEGFVYEVTNENESAIKIVRYKGGATRLVIPDEIDGYKVKSISDEAFFDCWLLTRIEIPGCVTGIGNEAFSDNSGIIFYVESGSYAETWATDNGRRVVTGKMPELKTSADGFVYDVPNEAENALEIVRYEGNDTEVVIPEKIDGYEVKSIGNGAFFGYENLTSIVIPSSVTQIGDFTFQNCENLLGIEIPSGVTSIGEQVFFGCRSLTSVIIPESLTSIGERAFFDCNSLTGVEIPEGVTSIGERAFDACSGLTSVEIPGSVTSIGDSAFPYNDDMIFYVESGSYAETWAKDDGRTFVVGKMSDFKEISDLTISEIKDQCYTGSAVTPSVTIKDGEKILKNGTDYTLTYANNLKVGKATVTITGKGFYTGSRKETFTITAKSVSGLTVAIKSQSYTGSAVKPSVTVTDGKKTLKNGTDYTLTYANNVNAGKAAAVTITGKGNYAGSKKVTFTITAKSVSGLTVPAIGSQFYTGKSITPAVTVKDGKKTLKKGTDYTVSYANNKKTGTATVTVAGKGNYAGSKKVTFTILPNVTGVKAVSADYSSVKVSWKKVSGVTGYKVYRSDSKNGKYTCIKTIKGAGTVTCKDGKLTTGKTYYYKVRAYVSGQDGSLTAAVSAKPTLASASLSSVSNTGAKTATVKWKQVSGASGYEVYSATAKNGKYKKIITVKKISTVSYKDTKLKKGSTYYYKVRAYRTVSGKKVYGGYSAVKNVKIKK